MAYGYEGEPEEDGGSPAENSTQIFAGSTKKAIYQFDTRVAVHVGKFENDSIGALLRIPFPDSL